MNKMEKSMSKIWADLCFFYKKIMITCYIFHLEGIYKCNSFFNRFATKREITLEA